MIQLLATINDNTTFHYDKDNHMWVNVKDKNVVLKNICIKDRVDILRAFMTLEMMFGLRPVKIVYREICLN